VGEQTWKICKNLSKQKSATCRPNKTLSSQTYCKPARAGTKNLSNVSRNQSLDHLRKIKRRGYSEELTDIYMDETAHADDSTRALLLRRLIAPHLEKLSPQTAQAIILSVVHGLSSREIGERINVPTNTVKSWVRRGLKKLRQDMAIDDIAELI